MSPVTVIESAPVALQLPVTREPVAGKQAARAWAENHPDRWVEGLDPVIAHLWEQWGSDLAAAGVDRHQFGEVATEYRQELWHWLWGNRTWAQCIEGLAGRLIRRQPGGGDHHQGGTDG